MKTSTKIVAGTLAAFSLATAGAVFAHQGMGMGMGPGIGMGPGMGMGHPMGPGMRGAMQGPQTAAAAAPWLADLKAELKITPAQDGAWQAYAKVVQQQAVERETTRAQMQAQMQAANAADRSAHFEAMSKVREQHLAARSTALKDLYAGFTPEQKALADQRLNAMPGHRMAWRAPAK